MLQRKPGPEHGDDVADNEWVFQGEGDSQSWVTVTRTGKFWDPRYGDFEITLSMLQEMVRNLDRKSVV